MMNHEHPNSIEQPNLARLDTSEIVFLLKKYNEQFGMGATVGRMFNSLLETEDEERQFEERETTSLEDQKVEELMSFEEMNAKAQGILTRTGLEFQPVKASWFVTGSEGTHLGQEMRLDLKNGKQFVSYLETLNPDTITESQSGGLKEIASVLTKQLTESYDLTDAEDERLLELLGNLSKIVDEYKRLDKGQELTKSVSPLGEYLVLARKGTLREYREAEKLHLNKPFINEGFILRWQTDASPKFLQEHWDEVLKALQAISQNSKAGEIYNQAKSTAMAALEAALTDVSSWSNAKEGYRAKKSEFLSILKTTKAKLADF